MTLAATVSSSFLYSGSSVFSISALAIAATLLANLAALETWLKDAWGFSPLLMAALASSTSLLICSSEEKRKRSDNNRMYPVNIKNEDV